MSTKAKAAFGTAAVLSIAMISYVHLNQQWERQKLHEGVVKDVQRQKNKKRQKDQEAATQVINNSRQTLV